MSASTTPDNLGVFAAALSDELNAAWDPAWNVVLNFYPNGSNYDTVLYGYGFNGHWLWYNGYAINLGYVSFVIWKDYNCITWYTIDSFNAATFISRTFSASDTSNAKYRTAYIVNIYSSTHFYPTIA